MTNVAVIGCGYWGPNLIRNFNSLENTNVHTICDSDPSRLKKIKELFPQVNTSESCSDIIDNDNIEAVAIATPVRTHYEIAKRCLLANKHVLIEKPMAGSLAECQELNEVADYRRLILMVGHTFIYSPVVRKIKEIIDNNELGNIQYIGSRRLNLGLFQKDINVAWDLAPHDLSIVLYLLEQNPVSISCHGKDHMMSGVEDVTCMILEFENNCFVTINNSWLDPNKVREMTVVGTKKMLVYDDIEPLEKIKIYDKRVINPPHYNTFGEFQYSYHYGDIQIPFVKQYETLHFECNHFVDCIRKRKKPDTSGYEGMNVVRILEAATLSLRNNGLRICMENQNYYNQYPILDKCRA